MKLGRRRRSTSDPRAPTPWRPLEAIRPDGRWQTVRHVLASGHLAQSGVAGLFSYLALVSLVLTLHYGNEASLRGQAAAAGMLPALMMTGTKKHDRQALREELDRLGVIITAGQGGFGRASCAR